MGFPNVCLTPAPPAPAPIPIPYPCQTMGPTGVPAPTVTILWGGAPVHTLLTVHPMTMFGPPGVAGVMSGTVMGPAKPVTGAFSIIVRGGPVTRMTSMSLGNLTNCPPQARIAPSQVKVMVLAP